MKKIELDERLYTVCSMDEYTEHPDMYTPKFTAIDRGDVVLPLKNRTTDVGPGIYYQQGAMVCMVEQPEEVADYSSDKIIDFTNVSSIREVFEKQQIIRDIQDEIMTTSDNILQLKVSDADTPEMKALKTAINSKRIDPKQYEDRFDQFQNDMRLLKGHSITLGKLVSISSAFDLSADLIIRDRDESVPNPMNDTITIDLTEGRNPK
jgi:hypothetical protein